MRAGDLGGFGATLWCCVFQLKDSNSSQVFLLILVHIHSLELLKVLNNWSEVPLLEKTQEVFSVEKIGEFFMRGALLISDGQVL